MTSTFFQALRSAIFAFVPAAKVLAIVFDAPPVHEPLPRLLALWPITSLPIILYPWLTAVLP